MYRVDESFRRRFISYARVFSESRGTSHDALRSLRVMKHQTQLTPALYCTWIDTLAIAGEHSALRGVLAEMRAREVPVNQEHYKRLIFAMSKAREYAACEELARDMKTHRIAPNTEFFDYLLTRSHSEQLSPVWEILRGTSSAAKSNVAQATPNATQNTTQNAKQATPSIPQATPAEPQPIRNATQGTQDAKPPPTPSFITHLIDSIRGANHTKCLELLREMRSMYPNAALYNTLISHAPDEGIAWMVVNEMTTQGVRPTHYTFNTLLRIPSALGVKACADVLVAMKKYGISPDAVTYNQLMKLRVDAMDKKGCIAFWEMMKKKKITPTVTTYNQLLHLARKLRDRKWYEEVKEEMKMNWIEPNVATVQLLQEPGSPNYWLN